MAGNVPSCTSFWFDVRRTEARALTCEEDFLGTRPLGARRKACYSPGPWSWPGSVMIMIKSPLCVRCCLSMVSSILYLDPRRWAVQTDRPRGQGTVAFSSLNSHPAHPLLPALPQPSEPGRNGFWKFCL